MNATATYQAGDVVAYEHDLGEGHVLGYNCSQVKHHGTVTAVESDASGDQVVTVEFDCGLTQDILASELSPAPREEGMDARKILVKAGVIERAEIRPDDTVNVINGDRRLCFGPATTETGQPAAGWDATAYERERDEDGEWWQEVAYTYAETDDEMTALAAGYAG